VQHKAAAGTGAPAHPAIAFEDALTSSKIDFVLKNDISPQRYTFETMAGGAALFD
jgi:hypothetical protein